MKLPGIKGDIDEAKPPTLLSYPMQDTIVVIGDGDTFELLADLLPLEAHVSEVFRFVRKNESAYNIAEMFQASLRKQERLGMVLVTEHGGPDECLLGIITAWDMAPYF